MTLKKCILTANDCYKTGSKISGGKPTGIVVHSTGANNPNLCRYVQPSAGCADYDAVIADLGKNRYSNSWNRSGVGKCVHAFIGKNAAGEVETYQTLPFDICCWGVGSGKKGSYNYNPTARIQFEMCEDALSDATYFNAVMKEAQEFCAYLCEKFGFGVDKISSHYETGLAGYGSIHSDPHNWLKKYGKDMDWFRTEVQKRLNVKQPAVTPAPAPTPSKPASSAGKIAVKEWQLAAIADGFKFPKYGADGAWGAECENVAKQAVCKKRVRYTYKNLTKLVQRVVGTTADGLFGNGTANAVKAWQKSHGLTADGCVGVNTWKKMLGI